MEERRKTTILAAESLAPLMSEAEASDLIKTLSHRTMHDLAVRYAFNGPIPQPIRVILEWMPAIRALYGIVSTKKLCELICREMNLENRQALRVIQKAANDEWIIPKPCLSDKRYTDNVYNPCRKIPEAFSTLHELYVAIGNTVSEQLKSPLDISAGRHLLPKDVYHHPVAVIQAKRLSAAPAPQSGRREGM